MPLQRDRVLDATRATGVGPPTDWMSRYARLAEAICTVKRRCQRLVILGTSTLNPRHPIPPDYTQMMSLLAHSQDPRAPGTLAMLGQWVWCVAYAVREMLRLAYVRWHCRGALRRLKGEPAAVVMKTWGFGAEFVDDARDFYYGTLPKQLQDRGLRCLLVVGDTRERMDRAFIERILRSHQGRALPEEALMPWWAPLVVACRQGIAAVALRRLTTHSSTREMVLVARTACRAVLQPITLRNTMHYYAARNAVRRWQPRAYLTLYEGQPWEQPSWRGAKAARPDCVTVGYQHTIIMPHSFSLLRPNAGSWEPAAPEVALCVGGMTRRMMEPGHARSGTRFVTFGTFRRPVGDGLHGAPHPQRRTVLVLPEGNLPESKVIFDFAIQAAGRLPDHHFIFRCHPMLSFEHVRPHLHAVPERGSNIALSTGGPILEEFQRTSVLLYRGSSAALYALLHGIKPIYIEVPGSPDIDPLFELTGWRERVSSVERCADRLTQYATSREEEALAQWREAGEYAHAYVKPVDEPAIETLLEAVGMVRSSSAHSVVSGGVVTR